MLDLSLEAIEADLTLAEGNAGRPLERIALARAQITATLIAAGVQQTSTEKSASQIQAEAVAEVRGYYLAHPEEAGQNKAIRGAMADGSYWNNNVEPQDDMSHRIAADEALTSVEVEPDGLEADFDVFTEARKARKK